MGRVAKRSRAVTPPLSAPDHNALSTHLAAKSLCTKKRSTTPLPKRVESKTLVPQLSDLDDDKDAASVHSDESVEVENSQEKEDALVIAGGELTGDALKEFLQTNFIDYIDDKIIDIPSLDSLST